MTVLLVNPTVHIILLKFEHITNSAIIVCVTGGKMDHTLTYEELQGKIRLLEKASHARKITEKKLKESEKRFRDIADNALAWIWEVDPEGRYIYSNHVVKQILGYESDEVVGKHFYDFFHPDDKEKLKDLAFQAFTLKRSFRRFVNRNIHKDGRMVILSTSGSPVLDEQGALKGYRGADSDITDYYFTNQALRENEEHLRSLLESASGLSIYRLVYDQTEPEKLRVLLVSPSIKEVLGVPEPMKFETWFDYIHPDDVDRIRAAHQRAFETMRFDEEYRTFNAVKNEWRWVHTISTGGRDEDEWNGFVNGIMIDITDRQRALRELKAQGELLMEKNRGLEELNAALKVFLTNSQDYETHLQERITSNLNQVVFPYLKKMADHTRFNTEQKELLKVVWNNLHDLTASFSHQLSSTYYGLTPTEIKVADLVRQGQKNKRIAELLYMAPRTVESHRENIRKKLGIKNKKINLRSHLMLMK